MIPLIAAALLLVYLLFDLTPADLAYLAGRSVHALVLTLAHLPHRITPARAAAALAPLPPPPPAPAPAPIPDAAAEIDALGPGTVDYLVLARSQIRAMPAWWQEAFALRLRQIEAAYAHVQRPETYEVIPVAVRTVDQIDTANLYLLDVERIQDEATGDYRYLLDGTPIANTYQLLWPVEDPAAGHAHLHPVLDEIAL